MPVGTGSLPPHHRDPFDRLPIALVTNRELPVVTADSALSAFSAYSIKRIG